MGLQGTEGSACSLYFWYHHEKGIHKSLQLSLAAGFRHQATEQSMTVIPGMYGVHCKHSSSIQPLISNNNLVLLGYGSMCTGTLDHIARYPSKTSNNNKALIVDLLYDSIYSCLFNYVSWLSFMLSYLTYSCPLPLGYSLFIVICLDPWICIFRFRDLERSGSFHGRSGILQRAGWSDLVPSCRTSLFGSRVSISYVSTLCISLYIFFWTWLWKQNTCKV